MSLLLNFAGALNVFVVISCLSSGKADNIPIAIMCGIFAALCFIRGASQ